MTSDQYLNFKRRMKLSNWKFTECNTNTWRIKNKKGIYVQSNLDIIVSKNIDVDQLEIQFHEFNPKLSDHK